MFLHQVEKWSRCRFIPGAPSPLCYVSCRSPFAAVTMARMPVLRASGSAGQASMTADRSESIGGDFRGGFSAGAVSPMGRCRNPLRFRLLALDGLQPSKLDVEKSPGGWKKNRGTESPGFAGDLLTIRRLGRKRDHWSRLYTARVGLSSVSIGIHLWLLPFGVTLPARRGWTVHRGWTAVGFGRARGSRRLA